MFDDGTVWGSGQMTMKMDERTPKMYTNKRLNEDKVSKKRKTL